MRFSSLFDGCDLFLLAIIFSFYKGVVLKLQKIQYSGLSP